MCPMINSVRQWLQKLYYSLISDATVAGDGHSQSGAEAFIDLIMFLQYITMTT